MVKSFLLSIRPSHYGHTRKEKGRRDLQITAALQTEKRNQTEGVYGAGVYTVGTYTLAMSSMRNSIPRSRRLSSLGMVVCVSQPTYSRNSRTIVL